jgi:hypothetical protein
MYIGMYITVPICRTVKKSFIVFEMYLHTVGIETLCVSLRKIPQLLTMN